MDSLPVQFLNNGFTQHNYNKLKSKIKSLIFLKLLFFPVSNFSKFSNDLNKKGINYRKINKCAVCFATLSFYCMRTQNRISFYTERSKTGEMVHFGKKRVHSSSTAVPDVSKMLFPQNRIHANVYFAELSCYLC